MVGQPGFFDSDERLQALSAAGDPLERLAAVLDFEVFRSDLIAALSRSDRTKGGRPPYDPVLMFKVLVLQTLYTLSDDQTEYQLKDRLSFMRFVGLSLHDAVPDDLALSRAVGASRRGGAIVRAVRRAAASQRLAGDGRADRRRYGDRGAPAAADPGGEGHDQRRRGAGRVETGAARADRPRRALDDQARQEA